MLSSKDRHDRVENVIRSKRFIGVVRANFSSLEFVGGRQIDPKVVDELKRTFEKNKVRRYKSDNYIRALITVPELRKALRTTGLSQQALQTTAKNGSLSFLIPAPGQKLRCVEGKHRIAAAKGILPPEDHWWTIKLLQLGPDEIVEEVGAPWANQYYHQNKFSDGEVYRSIRLDSTSQSEVDECMSRLSPCKQVALRQILKYKEFSKAFDDLLCFPGLWGGLELGNIQRHFATGCDEEWKHDLVHLKKTWENIMLNRPDLYRYVGIQDVELLQRRAPGLSEVDREFTINAIRKRLIFSGIKDKRTRRELRNSLLQVRCLIPSMKSMHENMKYIEIGAKIIKKLILGKSLRKTIYLESYSSWIHAKQSILDSEERKRWNPIYNQIWIYALRLFADLGGRSPRIEVGSPKNGEGHANINTQYEFVRYVRDLGLRTNQIDEFLATDPRKETLRHSLSKIYGKVPDEQILESLVAQLPRDGNKRQPKEPLTTVYVPTDEDDLERRWGVPFQRTYEAGKLTFFLHNIARYLRGNPKETLGASFFQADFFRAFFDIPESAVELVDESMPLDDSENGDGENGDGEDGDGEDGDGEDEDSEDDDCNEKVNSSHANVANMWESGGASRTQDWIDSKESDLSDLNSSHVDELSFQGLSDTEESPRENLVQWSPLRIDIGSSIPSSPRLSSSMEVDSVFLGPDQDYQSSHTIPKDVERSVVFDMALGADININATQSEREATVFYPHNSSATGEEPILSKGIDVFSTYNITSSSPTPEPPRSPNFFAEHVRSKLGDNHPDSQRQAFPGLNVPPQSAIDEEIPQSPRRSIVSLSSSTTVNESQHMLPTQQYLKNVPGSGSALLPSSAAHGQILASGGNNIALDSLPSQYSPPLAISVVQEEHKNTEISNTDRSSSFSPPSDPRRSEYSLPSLRSICSARELVLSEASRPTEYHTSITTPISWAAPGEQPVELEWSENSLISEINFTNEGFPGFSQNLSSPGTPFQDSELLISFPENSHGKPFTLRDRTTESPERLVGTEVALFEPQEVENLERQSRSILPLEAKDYKWLDQTISPPNTIMASLFATPQHHDNFEQIPNGSLTFAFDASNIGKETRSTETPVRLRFLEYNGMTYRLVEIYGDEMGFYLSNRLEYSMFVKSGRTAQTITKQRILNEMMRRPNELYCLVHKSRKAWWQRSGVKHVQEYKSRNNGKGKVSKPLLRGPPTSKISHRQLKLIENQISSASKHDSKEGEVNEKKGIPTTVMKSFGVEDSIQRCEQACSDCKYVLSVTQRCFLTYEASGVRALHMFHIESFPAPDDIMDQISSEYTGFFQDPKGIQPFDLKLLVAIASMFVVWLVAKDEVEHFLELRQHDALHHGLGEASEAEPPESGWRYGEESLFEGEESGEDQEGKTPTPNDLDQQIDPTASSPSRSSPISDSMKHQNSHEEIESSPGMRKIQEYANETQRDLTKGPSSEPQEEYSDQAEETGEEAVERVESSITDDRANTGPEYSQDKQNVKEQKELSSSGDAMNRSRLKRVLDSEGTDSKKVRHVQQLEPKQKKLKVAGGFTSRLKRRLEIQGGEEPKRLKLLGQYTRDAATGWTTPANELEFIALGGESATTSQAGRLN